jgi:ferredoxin
MKLEGLVEVASWLKNENYDIDIEVVTDLCHTPKKISDFKQKNTIDRTIIGACRKHSYLFNEEVNKTGTKPFTTIIIDLLEQCYEGYSNSISTERTKILLSSAIKGQKVLAASKEAKIYKTLLPQNQRLNRRAFFKIPLKLHPRMVPSIKTEICKTSQGCKVCVDECPKKALFRLGQKIQLEPSKCNACGACVTSCPSSAFQLPFASQKKILAEVNALAKTNTHTLNPRIVLYSCRGGRKYFNSQNFTSPPYPPNMLVENIPCMASLNPFILLKTLELGAEAVGLIHCENECECGYQFSKMHESLEISREILRYFNVAPSRIFSVEPRDKLNFSNQLTKLNEKILSLGPHNLNDEKAHATPNLLSLVKRFSEKSNSFHPNEPLRYIKLPFLSIKVNQDSCTMCGICVNRCPTKALNLIQKDLKITLSFDYNLCIACHDCITVCPDQALSSERILDIRKSSPTTVLNFDKMITCERCKEPFTFSKKTHQIIRLSSNSETYDQLISKFCSKCRLVVNL